jgi:hypothetical protein
MLLQGGYTHAHAHAHASFITGLTLNRPLASDSAVAEVQQDFTGGFRLYGQRFQIFSVAMHSYTNRSAAHYDDPVRAFSS